MIPSAFDLVGTYVQLKDGGDAEPVTVDASFWAQIQSRSALHHGRLIMAFELSDDMAHWEMHPAGDELLILQSGAVDVVLDQAGGEAVVPLDGAAACIVPKGTWHRLKVRTPGRLIFITPGEGTQHRPL